MPVHTLEPAPVELLVLLEHPGERPQWLRAAQRVGILLTTSNDTSELLSQFTSASRPPDAVLIPLGSREEESLLLFRALSKRQSRRHPSSVFFLDRGARILRTQDDAMRFGADGLLPDLPCVDLLASVLSRIDIPLDAEVPDEWEPIIPPPPPPPKSHVDFSRASISARSTPRPQTPPPIPNSERLSLPRIPTHPPIPNLTQEATQRIKSTLSLARTQHYFALINLPPSSPLPALQTALSDLASKLSPPHIPPEILTSLAADLTEIHQTLSDAWTILSHPSRLEAYRRAILKHSP